jgi:two-component system sensor histidine kinase UhpB
MKDKTKEQLIKKLEDIIQKSDKKIAELQAELSEYKQAENTLQDIIGNNPLSIQIVDKNGITISVNDAHTKLFGAAPPESYSIFTDPQLKAQGIDKFFKKLKKGEVVYFPDSFFNPHDLDPTFPDAKVWIRVLGFPIVNHKKPERFILMHENITERKDVEVALRRSEEKYRNIFENIQDVYCLADMNGLIKEISPSIEMYTEYMVDELICKPISILYYDANDRELLLKTLMEKGKINDFEVRAKTKSGDVSYISINAQIIRDSNGNPKYVSSFIRNVTERKLMEDAIKNSEENYRMLFENVQDVFYKVATKGNIIEISPSIKNIIDYNREELIGKISTETYAIAADRNAFLAALKEKGELLDYEIKLRSKTGEIKYASANAQLISGDNDSEKYIIGALRDISERKKAEQELNKTVEELKQLTDYIQNVRENERKAIAGEIHDDLGQALTAISMDLGIVTRNFPDKEITLQIRKISEMVNDTIKSVQRITSDLRPEIINDLGLEAAIDWYTKEFAKRSYIKVKLNLDHNIPLNPNAALNIYRILQESFTNIARHARATQVEVVIKRSADFITLIIADNGRGISDDEIRSGKSFGILSMKERVASLGGSFEIKHKNKGGTEIRISVPLQNNLSK